jgi:serine/threonine protein kinase
LDSDNRIKIGDFGLATSRFALNVSEVNVNMDFDPLTKGCGTRMYMAPELFYGNGMSRAQFRELINETIYFYSTI